MKALLLAALLAISSSLFAQQGGFTGGGGSGAPTTCATGTYVCTAGATLTGALQAPVVNGITNASLPASSDIGPAVNAAIASLGSTLGTVVIDPTQKSGGVYNQQTTINIPLGDVLDCQGAELFWNVTSGQQFHYGSTVANSYLLGGIKNCRLGSGGTGNATTSIYAGGDPNGTITPSNTYGNFMFVEDTSIFGFGTGFTHGSNFWAGKLDNVALFGNYDNLLSAPSNATNMGEATIIKSSKIFNAVHCGLNLNNTSDVYYVDAGSIDYNGNQGVGAGVCGTAATVTLHDVWEEQPYGPFINITGTTGLNVVRVNGGHAVQSTYANTITNVAITSNVLSLTITGTTTFYAVNMPLVLTGLTTATFLNNQSVTVTAFNSGTGVVTAAFTHADYASAADTGTTTPTAPDLWHVEGVFGSYANIQDVTSQSNGAFYTLGVGVGSGTDVRVCVANTSGVHQFLAVPTNIIEGCTYSVPFRIQFNNSIASFSPDSTGLQTAGQGWSYLWNLHLAGLTGETDYVNVRGVGLGGWAWCDGVNNFVPSTACTSTLIQMFLNGSTGQLFLPKFMTPSELVFTDSNNGLISGTVLPAGTKATTPGAADNSTLVPTTAWIQTNTATLLGPYATTSALGAAVTGLAPLASPALTGTPTAPTATALTNTTQLATGAEVVSSILAAKPPINGTDSGTGAAYVVTTTPTILANAAGVSVCFMPHTNSSTSAPTLAVDGLTAETIVQGAGAILTGVPIQTVSPACVINDGTHWVLQNSVQIDARTMRSIQAPASATAGCTVNALNANTYQCTPINLAVANCSATASASSTLIMVPGYTATCNIGLASNQGVGWTAPSAGTVSNLTVRCTTTGFNTSSGVFTIYHTASGINPATSRSATTVTVTYGTTVANTIVADNTHTATYAAGDLIQVLYTTQATETLAGCSVNFNL